MNMSSLHLVCCCLLRSRLSWIGDQALERGRQGGVHPSLPFAALQESLFTPICKISSPSSQRKIRDFSSQRIWGNAIVGWNQSLTDSPVSCQWQVVTSEVATSGAVTYFHSKLWQKACFPMHRPLSIQNSSPHFPSNPVMTTHPSSYPCIHIFQGPIPPLQWEISQFIWKRFYRVNFTSPHRPPWRWRLGEKLTSRLQRTLRPWSRCIFVCFFGNSDINLPSISFDPPCISFSLHRHCFGFVYTFLQVQGPNFFAKVETKQKQMTNQSFLSLAKMCECDKSVHRQ